MNLESLRLTCRVDALTGCWFWTGALHNQGYGTYGGGADKILVHRMAWELANGPIPEGLVIDHLCRQKLCCNPAHLEAVTQQTNVLRGVSPMAINARKTHCDRGHEFTPHNTVRNSRGRQCRKCKNEINRAYDIRRRGHVEDHRRRTK